MEIRRLLGDVVGRGEPARRLPQTQTSCARRNAVNRIKRLAGTNLPAGTYSELPIRNPYSFRIKCDLFATPAPAMASQRSPELVSSKLDSESKKTKGIRCRIPFG